MTPAELTAPAPTPTRCTKKLLGRIDAQLTTTTRYEFVNQARVTQTAHRVSQHIRDTLRIAVSTINLHGTVDPTPACTRNWVQPRSALPERYQRKPSTASAPASAGPAEHPVRATRRLAADVLEVSGAMVAAQRSVAAARTTTGPGR
jgi:hypothetical protein